MNIFEHHLAEIKEIILSKKNFLKLDQIDNLKGVNLERIICDYIAGMTDRYAINLYNQIK